MIAARRSLRRLQGTALVLAAALLPALAPAPARAQTGGAFLLLPTGPRAVGRGGAAVADSGLGAEAIWWNPAAFARIGKQELAILHFQDAFIESADMLVYARPSKVLGTIAAAAYLVNLGDQEATDGITGAPIGLITNRNYLFALSYASPVGKRFSGGLTYKLVRNSFNCTGRCGDTPTLGGNTNALDLGAQYRLGIRLPVTLGASVRNIGPDLQVKDKDQADPLPRLAQVGAKARFSLESTLPGAGATVDVSADLLVARGVGDAQSLGAALSFRDQLYISGGFRNVPDAEGRTLSVGFGLQRGKLGFDVARRFGELISALGEPPVYFALRARF